ncbi:ATP synthase-coupling factor 6, mitochondrial-like [Salarias fasciatus]|uniref:ATP synthase-coupling factor 6, mitochondrial-like n=1 Tax=Salarias fasciatus TaxID=181472 RepID=UPI001176CE6D|nr:ATP synthase-coupling factor 6, mitochondrial-like [Salarias fasciatus]
MAAALCRRGAAVRCIHRELYRVVWGSQTVFFSSNPTDRKQLRRTHINLDLVQSLFLQKIREYNQMYRLNSDQVLDDPVLHRRFSEETIKLQQQFGGGDLTSFPDFHFPEPELDPDSR